jgi:adenylate kinase
MPGSLMVQLRSLNIEHVSSAELIAREISRQTPAGAAVARAHRQGLPLPVEPLLAIIRRWFMTRKPDAGFALTGFPATLLQAQVFDDWLETRDESLDAVLAMTDVNTGHVHEHYRTLGLLQAADLSQLS